MRLRNGTALLLVVLLMACGKDEPAATEADAADESGDLSFPDVGLGGDDAISADTSLGDVVVSNTCSDEDSFSPNHSPSEPYALDPMGVNVEDLHLCPGHDDYFLIDLDPGQGIFVQIEFAHRLGDLDMWLFPEGTTNQDSAVALSAEAEDVEQIRYVSSDGGTFLLFIDGFEDAGGFYDLFARPTCRTDADCPCSEEACEDGLTMSCVLRGRYCEESETPLCGDDNFEPNNSMNGASELDVTDSDPVLLNALVCGDDQDYFLLTLDDVSDLAVSLEFDSGDDLDVAVLTPDGDVVGFAGTGENPERLELSQLGAGDYVIYIDTIAGGTSEQTYSLQVLVEGVDACESDDDCNYTQGRSICVEETGGCIGYSPDEPNPVGGECDSDDDCDDSSEFCLTGGPGFDDNVCSRRCRGDNDCGPGLQCLSGGGRFGYCIGTCEAETDCPVPYQCNAGSCEYVECNIDSDCGDDQACLRTDDGSPYCRTYDEPTCQDEEADGNGRMTDATEFPLEDGNLDDLTICNADQDWYSFDVAEGPALVEISVEFEGETDLDIYFMDAEGETVGAAVTPTGNPEVVQADFVAAGSYFVLVNQFAGEGGDALTTYSIDITISLVDGCTEEGQECMELQPFRIACQEDGSCGFLDGNGEIELGGLCDSQDDCSDSAEFCYTFQSASPGENICTRQCGGGDDCNDVDGAECRSLGGRFALCLPGE